MFNNEKFQQRTPWDLNWISNNSYLFYALQILLFILGAWLRLGLTNIIIQEIKPQLELGVTRKLVGIPTHPPRHLKINDERSGIT